MSAPERRFAGETDPAPRRDGTSALLNDLRADRLRRHVVNMGLWTVQGWLAMFFVAAGWAKITQPIARLQDMLGWPWLLGDAFTRLFGVCESLLGLAVVAPLASWRLRLLMVTSCRTLFTLAAVAAAFHALRGPLWFSGLNAVVAGFCLLVFVGRAGAQAD